MCNLRMRQTVKRQVALDTHWPPCRDGQKRRGRGGVGMPPKLTYQISFPSCLKELVGMVG
jgi:hypothetical protein